MLAAGLGAAAAGHVPHLRDPHHPAHGPLLGRIMRAAVGMGVMIRAIAVVAMRMMLPAAMMLGARVLLLTGVMVSTSVTVRTGVVRRKDGALAMLPGPDAALVKLGAAVPDRARTGRIVAGRLARAVVGALAGRTGTDQPQSGDGGKQEQLLHDRPPSTRRR